jgi:hypothetical protein
LDAFDQKSIDQQKKKQILPPVCHITDLSHLCNIDQIYKLFYASKKLIVF